MISQTSPNTVGAIINRPRKQRLHVNKIGDTYTNVVFSLHLTGEVDRVKKKASFHPIRTRKRKDAFFSETEGETHKRFYLHNMTPPRGARRSVQISLRRKKYDGMVLPSRRSWVKNCIFNTKQKFESYKEYLISQRNPKVFWYKLHYFIRETIS